MTPNQTPTIHVRRKPGKLEALAGQHRIILSLAIHLVLFTVALLSAFLIRFDAISSESNYDWSRGFHGFLIVLPWWLIGKTLVFGPMKLFQGGWNYSSIRDAMRIVFASWIFFAVAVIAVYLFRFIVNPDGGMGRVAPEALAQFFSNLPRGVIVLDFIASVFLVCAARLAFRVYHEQHRPVSDDGVRRVLLVGAGDAAEMMIREILRMDVERYRVIGMVDDNPQKQHLRIHDIPVLGTTDDIRALCEQHEIEEILIAIPSASSKDKRRVIEQCEGTKVKFQSLPSLTDLIDQRVMVSQIRPVDINDLLGRDAIELDDKKVSEFLTGRTILITGAGGSIGSEMCRQVVEFAPKRLILVEQSETPMFDIHNELRKTHPNIPYTPCICDIYDRDRVMTTWEKHKPDVVIHAAAHKHVPLMEWNPCEAVKNNIAGTRNVADASCKTDVAEFVMISTDKAVNPSSVMGCSKRVAEIYTQARNGHHGCKTQFKAVRFGNVLGSNGSVVPTFRKQIAAGGPVTVTHKDMTRYFMTIPEAAQLVLQAAAGGKGGQIFLLDMGEPVKISDLARQMITLSGFIPGEDIEIVYSGVRPGEKLYEELRNDTEDIEPTVNPKIFVWAHQPTPWEQVETMMTNLVSLSNTLDRQQIVDALQQAVPEYTPLNPPKA